MQYLIKMSKKNVDSHRGKKGGFKSTFVPPPGLATGMCRSLDEALLCPRHKVPRSFAVRSKLVTSLSHGDSIQGHLSVSWFSAVVYSTCIFVEDLSCCFSSIF